MVDAFDVTTLTNLLATLIRADAAVGWADPPAETEVGELLTTLVDAGPSEAQVVVARVDETVVGFGYWRRYTRTTLRPQADLERLAVATDFSGRGIGRTILRDLIRTARDAGCEQLTIDFRGDNQGAERLYLSEGFAEYGRLRNFVAPDATRRFDKVFQVLDLRA
ncbi:hypothetical protein GCM10011492_04770 [Flexivirga endophytica]|uniref:N-acetyltransferase domain-containing protein n=1 Tax=Flexivirga endophytica TaxID=1849103 RepID=A0A916WPF6_9MICO|nr:hypothetical protein GCM10011492_04770 [Flexivirga endophytica]GHB37650.1 hypothetical protein GCM10008112_02840 [Flexivirga endophytica]